MLAIAAAWHTKSKASVPWFLEGSDTCRHTWPPEARCVADYLPIGLGCLCLLLAVNLASFLLEMPSESTKDNIKVQHERRHNIVEEMIDELESNKDSESSVEVGQLRFKKVQNALTDLAELPSVNGTTLERGVRWCWAAFKKELNIAILKTKEGQDIEYAGGNKLKELLSAYDELYAFTRRQGVVQDKSEVKRIWKLVKDGRRNLRCVEREGVCKAMRLLWSVRQSLVWLALETLTAVLSAVATALSVYYRAEVLDNIQTGGEAFWLVTRAMVLVQLTASLLALLTKTLETRGRGQVAHEVKVKFYKALTERDAHWWATITKEGRDPSYKLWELDDEVKAFLEIPQSFSENLSTLVTHCFLVLRTSSRSFYMLLFLNFGSPLLFWLLGKMTQKLRPMILRGLVLPQFDSYTWMYAVDPQYVGTFQSFGRCKKECLNYRESDRAWLTYAKRDFLVNALEEPISALLSTSLDAAQIRVAGQVVSRGHARLPEAQALMKSSEEVSDKTKESWILFKNIVEKAQPLATVYDLCTLPTAIDPNSGFFPDHQTKGHIHFKDVTFSYPGRRVPVLKSVSLEVQPGQTVGITGKAGCGYVLTLSPCFLKTKIPLVHFSNPDHFSLHRLPHTGNQPS